MSRIGGNSDTRLTATDDWIHFRQSKDVIIKASFLFDFPILLRQVRIPWFGILRASVISIFASIPLLPMCFFRRHAFHSALIYQIACFKERETQYNKLVNILRLSFSSVAIHSILSHSILQNILVCSVSWSCRSDSDAFRVSAYGAAVDRWTSLVRLWDALHESMHRQTDRRTGGRTFKYRNAYIHEQTVTVAHMEAHNIYSIQAGRYGYRQTYK